jgi:hypothetical protein
MDSRFAAVGFEVRTFPLLPARHDMGRLIRRVTETFEVDDDEFDAEADEAANDDIETDEVEEEVRAEKPKAKPARRR